MGRDLQACGGFWWCFGLVQVLDFPCGGRRCFGSVVLTFALLYHILGIGDRVRGVEMPYRCIGLFADFGDLF